MGNLDKETPKKEPKLSSKHKLIKKQK